jgi:hypothetical protein
LELTAAGRRQAGKEARANRQDAEKRIKIIDGGKEKNTLALKP